MSGRVHDFRSSLAAGESDIYEPFWLAVYRSAFPDLVSLARNCADNMGQRLGIDRYVNLSSGKTLRVDEKVRPDRTDDSDIALEYVSNTKTRAAGWITKDELHIDFLAYAFPLIPSAYVLPWHVLRRVWRAKGAEWMAQYQLIRAANRGYETLSVCVPTPVLLATMSKAMAVSAAAIRCSVPGVPPGASTASNDPAPTELQTGRPLTREDVFDAIAESSPVQHDEEAA